MAMLLEMKKQHAEALNKAESIVQVAESASRALTAEENTAIGAAMAEADALTPQIANIEKLNTMRSQFPQGRVITEPENRTRNARQDKKLYSKEYMEAFYANIASGGLDANAALYEGSNTAGGYAVPVVVDDQIVPLAPNEMSVRQLATVIPTTSDIKFPIKAAFGSAASKAESGASANSFAGTAPTLAQTTLSAFMAGVTNDISWELAQDVPAFQSYLINDMLYDQQEYEENLFINGTGSGQAQGLIGNVGTGVSEEPDASGNLVSIDGTLDLIGSLKASYFRNASWLMARATSIIIRKAQRQANLFEPVWTRTGNQDYLHGYPVSYSSSMPAAARGATPVLFGDFKRCYTIGDRGGSGISVKILDQPKAVQGLLTLLIYRRTDGRVLRSEAVQSYNIAAS